MDKIVKYVVNCDTWYGVISLAILFLGLVALGYVAYKITQLVSPYIHKIVCKHCDTSKKYASVHIKFGVKFLFFEINFHRKDTGLE